MRETKHPIVLSILAGIVFILLSANHLEGQGLYFDELHQATGSFNYIGNRTLSFSPLAINNIPIMNMPYSGAIKTAIYGIFLLFFNQTFGLFSWRLLGILLVAISCVGFGFLTRKVLKPYQLLVFYFILLTDITVLLTSRHDWGPTTLALSLRIVFIGLWLKEDISATRRPINTFWMFLILGISLYEKLTAVVLIIPIFLLVFYDRKRINKKFLLAGFLGGIIGASPLIAANIISCVRSGYLISFDFSPVVKNYSVNNFLDYVSRTLSFGDGSEVQSFILGVNEGPINFELGLISIVLILTVIFIFYPRDKGEWNKTACLLLGCYIIIIVEVYFLPQQTWVHHWITGTPFQYVAIAVSTTQFSVRRQSDGYPKAKTIKIASSFFLFLLGISRLVGLVSLEGSLSSGKHSQLWDPSVNSLGKFSATHDEHTYYWALDWGVANQLICYMNGENGSVLQPPLDGDLAQIVEKINQSEKAQLYLVIPTQQVFLTDETMELLIRDLDRLLSPNWQKLMPEAEIANLRNIQIIKYGR